MFIDSAIRFENYIGEYVMALVRGHKFIVSKESICDIDKQLKKRTIAKIKGGSKYIITESD